MMRLYAICFYLALMSIPEAWAQTRTLQLDSDFSPQISVTGTSTLHDWKVTGSGMLEVPPSIEMTPNQPQGIPSFGFKVAVDSLDGGRGPTMNNKIYDAFNSSQNPYIIYQQADPAQVNQDANNKDLTISSTGKLSMAGVEKTITVSLQGAWENDLITFKGSKPLKMSDYGMTPPSAMFGQIKTHNDVVVHFEFRYRLSDDQ